MAPLVYRKIGPADVEVRSALLDGIGELCWWQCPHGQKIVAPAEWIRFVTCGYSHINAVGTGVGHQFAPALWARDAAHRTVPIFAQIEIWTAAAEEASRERAGAS